MSTLPSSAEGVIESAAHWLVSLRTQVSSPGRYPEAAELRLRPLSALRSVATALSFHIECEQQQEETACVRWSACAGGSAFRNASHGIEGKREAGTCLLVMDGDHSLAHEGRKSVIGWPNSRNMINERPTLAPSVVDVGRKWNVAVACPKVSVDAKAFGEVGCAGVRAQT